MVQETTDVLSTRFRPVPFPPLEEESALDLVLRTAEGEREPTALELVMSTPTAGERALGVAAGVTQGLAEPAISTLLATPRIVGRKIAGALVGGEERLQPEGESALAQVEAAVRGALPEVPEAVQRETGVGGFLTRDLLQGVATTGALVGTSLVGGGIATALAGAFTQGVGAYREAEAAGADPTQKFAAFLLNLPLGAADALPVEMIAGRLAPSLARIDKRSGGAISKLIATEGATEATQQALSNIVASDLAAYDQEREAWRGVPEAALLGGTVGALFGGAVEVARAARPGQQLTALDLVESRAAEQQITEQSPNGHSTATASVEETGPSDRPRTAADLLGRPEPEPPVERSLAGPVSPGPGPGESAGLEAGLVERVSGAEELAGAGEGPQKDRSRTSPGPVDVVGVRPDPIGSEQPSGSPGELARTEGEPEAPSKTTGVKNAVVDRELAEMGLEPAQHGDRTTFVAEHAKAKATLEADPLAGQKLVDELADSTRPPTKEESAVLAFEVNRLINARDAAEEAYLADPTEENQARIDRAKADYARAADVVTRAGTQSGQSLAFRKMMLARDYSLAAMERAVQVAKGGEPLTAEESAKVKELHDKLAAAEKAHAEYVTAAAAKQAELEAENALLQLKRDVRRAPRRKARDEAIARSRQRSEEIFQRIVARAGSARAGFDVELLADVAEFALEQVRGGFLTVSAKAEELISKFGDEMRPHVEAAWKAAREVVSTDLAEKVKARLAEGEKLTDLRRYVGQIAEHFVATGIEDRDALVNAVHEVLTKADPKITKEQARDAISGYGDFRPLSDDEVKRKLRDIKGQLQALAKLEALQKKQAPLRSGPERRTPSDAERALNKKVAELTKQLGIKTIDPAAQTKTALEALKTQLKNQIADLQTQIDTRTKIVDERAPVPRDAEARALEARRDSLREQFESIFPKDKRALTDEQRIAMATKAVEASIADIERQLAGGARTLDAPTPTTPELQALRARRDALRAELDELRAFQTPADFAGKEERRLAAAAKAQKTRLLNEAARTQERITFQDFGPPTPRQPVAMDPEAIRLKAEAEAMKLQFAREKRRHELRNRTRTQKIADALKEVVRLPQSLWTMWDFSATLRQGAVLSGARPLVTLTQHVPRMLRAAASAEYAARVDAEIHAHPLFESARAAGLQITAYGDALGVHEEALRSALSDRIPGKKASDRAFTTLLNLQRMDAYASMLRMLPVSETSARAKAIANYVNVASGRGNPGKLAGAMEGASYVLWSPRLLLSRLQLLAGQPLYGGDRYTRLAIAKSLGRSLVSLGAFYGMAQLAATWMDDKDKPRTVWDPRSSDFGKVIVGDTRVDPLAGLSQVVVLVSRLASGETMNTKGEVTPIRGDVPFGRDNAADVAFRFARSKANPVVGMALDMLSGKNMIGEDVSPAAKLEAVKASPTAAVIEAGPLSVRDMYELVRNRVAHRTGKPAGTLTFADVFDSMRKEGVPYEAALGLLSIFGMGVTTYDERAPKPKKQAQGQRSGS